MLGPVEKIVSALNQAGVRYLVVGGVAVVLHGRLRTTADLDLVLDLEPANVERALRVLKELGYHPRAPVPLEAFADPSTRRSWVETKNMTAFSLWPEEGGGFEVDLFVEEPFDFEAAYRRARRVPLRETEAVVVSREDLIELKRAAGRPQDAEDVDALTKLSEES